MSCLTGHQPQLPEITDRHRAEYQKLLNGGEVNGETLHHNKSVGGNMSSNQLYRSFINSNTKNLTPLRENE